MNNTGLEDRCQPRTQLGLSTVHISPDNPPGAIIYSGGSLMTVQRSHNNEIFHGVRGGKRGKATFSKSSRRRLMRIVAKLPRVLVPIFVTLTYPAEFPTDASVYKKHLDTWGKRFVRRFSGGFVIWRLEFQRRGAPHYHLLVYGVDKSDLMGWVHNTWYEVVGSGDEKHLAAGVRVEQLRDVRAGLAYTSKYMCKVDKEAHEGVGRYWGIIARSVYDSTKVNPIIVELDDRAALELLRYMRRFAHLPGRDYNKLTIFCDAEFWWLKLDHFHGTDRKAIIYSLGEV